MDIMGVHVWDYEDLTNSLTEIFKELSDSNEPTNHASVMVYKKEDSPMRLIKDTLMEEGAVFVVPPMGLQECTKILYQIEKAIPSYLRNVMRINLKPDDYDKTAEIFVWVHPYIKIREKPIEVGLLDSNRFKSIIPMDLSRIKSVYPKAHTMMVV